MKKNIIMVNGVKTTINEEEFKKANKRYKSGDDLVSHESKRVGKVFGAKSLSELLSGIEHMPYGIGSAVLLREGEQLGAPVGHNVIYKMADERDVRVSRSFKTFYADIKECEPEDELECVRLLVNSCRAEGWNIMNDDNHLCNVRGYMKSRKIRRIQEGRNFYITPIMDDLYQLFKYIKETNK